VEVERERLAAAIEQAGEQVVLMDVEGSIVYVNPAFEAVSGYSRAEALGKSWRMLDSSAREEEVARQIWAAVSAGGIWRGRLSNRRKDGARYVEEATVSPVRTGPGGATTAYVAVKRDVTSALALEEQLLQSQKMESVGRLAGGVAHDFNNLLTIILNNTQFALNDMHPDDPRRDDLDEVEEAARRASALTQQLLAFSRRQVLAKAPLDLNRIVIEMEKMLRRLLGEDVELSLQLSPALGVVVADRGQLEQVILNLAVNARDAMPKGGRLSIATADVTLPPSEQPGEPGGPCVELRVTDSGIGMDEATQLRIFEPFFTTKEKGRGTGLGLSTVYGIVTQSGGAVRVESAPGEGAVFRVLLPREQGGAQPQARQEVLLTPGGSETILLVEDDAAVRKVLRRMLEQCGYTVLAATDGEDALRLVQAHPGAIDLAITDVVMPKMGGGLFAERLAELRPEVKLLFMSGYTDDAIVQHGVSSGSRPFIAKPVVSAEMRAKIREVLDGK
jgi:two-component system, cell cycle sensor histidine kinase and response regulator CckA